VFLWQRARLQPVGSASRHIHRTQQQFDAPTLVMLEAVRCVDTSYYKQQESRHCIVRMGAEGRTSATVLTLAMATCPGALDRLRPCLLFQPTAAARRLSNRSRPRPMRGRARGAGQKVLWEPTGKDDMSGAKGVSCESKRSSRARNMTAASEFPSGRSAAIR
jgi:hypothetical protein